MIMSKEKNNFLLNDSRKKAKEIYVYMKSHNFIVFNRLGKVLDNLF